MGDSIDIKLKPLMRLYGFEVAAHNQSSDVKLLDKQEILACLALIHLEAMVGSAIEEYLGTVSFFDDESYAAVHGILEFFQEFLAVTCPGLAPDRKTLIETFSREWVKQRLEKANVGRKED